jgi:hypothetical protein
LGYLAVEINCQTRDAPVACSIYVAGRVPRRGICGHCNLQSYLFVPSLYSADNHELARHSFSSLSTFEWMPLSCDLQPLGCTSSSEELNITLQLEMLLEIQSAV